MCYKNDFCYWLKTAGVWVMGRVNNEIFQFSVPFKQRDVSQMERVVSSLNQDLLPTKEWKEFLISYKNKLQIVNLLVDYAKSGRIRDKVVIVDQGSGCFFKEYENDCVCFPKLDSLHREADARCLCWPRKQWYSLRCCWWCGYLSKPNQYFPPYSFSPLFSTRENQGLGWSKLSWYTCDSCSFWGRNLSNSTLLPYVDRFGFR